MDKYTEETIKEEMEGIHEIDLQNRLRKFYEEKRKIDSKILDNQDNKDTSEKIEEYKKSFYETLKDNN